MHIKIYGTPTSGNKMIKSFMGDILFRAKIPFKISEVQDITRFLEKNIESIPAIQLDEEPIVALKTNGSFNKSLRSAINHILSKENYGQLSKLIVPVDFKDASINAVSYAHRLATELGAVTKVVHVHDPGNESRDLKADNNSAIESKERLHNLVKSIDHDWGSDILKASFISSDFRVGTIAKGILQSSKENSAELIIMGSCISDNKNTRRHKSKSLEIIANANCSTLIVPPKAHYKGLSKVLLALDSDKITQSIIDVLKNIFLGLKSEIHILQSQNNLDFEVNLNLISKGIPELNIKSAVQKTENYITDIGDYAAENNIDIIALSPPSNTQFSSMLKRMTQRAIHINKAIPIMLLK